MNTHSSGAPTTRGPRLPRVIGITLLTATLAVGLAACQSSTQATVPEPEVRRAAPSAPRYLDLTRSADRIAEDIARREAELAAQFAGRPADRIEEELRRHAQTQRGLIASCGRYVVIEHGPDWRVLCVEMPYR